MHTRYTAQVLRAYVHFLCKCSFFVSIIPSDEGVHTCYDCMYRKRFADRENQDVVKRLNSEMKTLDPTVSSTHVRGECTA